MDRNILLIDGENFIHSIERTFRKDNIEKSRQDIISDVDIAKIFSSLLCEEKVYYAATVKYSPKLPEKSIEFIENNRRLKRKLEESGFIYNTAGRLIAQEYQNFFGKTKYKFNEKGTDVSIAVDVVTHAFEKTYSTIFLCSSDTDLLPALQKARELGQRVVYVHFKDNLMYAIKANTSGTVEIALASE